MIKRAPAIMSEKIGFPIGSDLHIAKVDWTFWKEEYLCAWNGVHET